LIDLIANFCLCPVNDKGVSPDADINLRNRAADAGAQGDVDDSLAWGAVNYGLCRGDNFDKTGLRRRL
jgi:hypothetical protein